MSDDIKELEDSLNKGELTKGQVWDYVKFVNGMYNSFGGYNYNTPQLANQNLIQLNNNASTPTFEKILQALERVPYSVSELQGYSEFMQTWDAIYQKTLRWYRGLLSFDYYMVCNNANTEDYKTEEYKKDKRRAERFMYSFNYKKEFDRVVEELLRTGQCYSWFRTNYGTFNDDEISDDIQTKKQSKFSLQIMPQKYCMLDGYWQSGLNYNLNMQYFLKSGVEIEGYDPSLMKKFKELYNNKNNEGYSSSAQLYDRDGSFAQWVQVSSEDGAWAWLFDDSNFSGTPPFANLMKSVFHNDEIESLQRDKDTLSAVSLLMGELELMDKTASGQQADQFAINPETLSALLTFVKNSLGKKIKQVPLPLRESKYAQFTDNSPLMAQHQYQMSSALGASASSMVYTNDKMAQFEMQSALLADYNLMKRLYLQFSDFINYFLNRKTKKYKFTIVFDGSNFPFEREKREESLIKFVNLGMCPNESFFANSLGVPPHMFSRMREEANATIRDNLTMLMNSNTMSSEDINKNKVGNQELGDSELSDSGSQSRDYQ